MPQENFDDDDILIPHSDRLRILTPEEYELLLGGAQFSSCDREVFFGTTPREHSALARLRTPRSKAQFLLQLGYFRARQRFFKRKRPTIGLLRVGAGINRLPE